MVTIGEDLCEHTKKKAKSYEVMASFHNDLVLKEDSSQMIVGDQTMDVEGSNNSYLDANVYCQNFGQIGQELRQVDQMKQICQRCMNGEPGHYNHLR